jgi:hypothetical protein
MLTLCCLFFSNLLAQSDFKVIKVSGSILYVRTGSSMAQGDVFPEDEDLDFATPNSRAAVINPEKGRFILSPGTQNQVSRSKSNFLPAMSNISTRGGALNSLADIQTQFSGEVSVLYSASWHINPYQFPMSEETFFYVQYLYRGERINKKLPFTGNNLLFSREDILKVDDAPIEKPDTPNAILYYYGKNGAQYISAFELVFPDLHELAAEARIILEESADNSYNRMVNELSGYIFEFYGKPDKQDVMQFMEKDLGVKK